MAEHATVAVEDVRFLLITLQHHIREMLHLPARPTSLSRGSNPMRPHVRSEVLAIGGCTAFRSKGPNSEPVHSGIFVGPFAAASRSAKEGAHGFYVSLHALPGMAAALFWCNEGS